MQSAISNLDSALGLSSYAATSSSNLVATAALSGSPSAGTYTVEVDSLGTYASVMSSDGLPLVSDPTQSGISSATSYTLKVGDASYNIPSADSTLSSLASAINQAGAGIQATVVNVGAKGSTDYRLSIQDNKMEDVAIQLTSKNGTSPGATLMSTQTTGAPTTYRVNGKPAADSDPLTTDSPNITLSPGVTAMLSGEGTATITVARNAGAVQTALTSFVSAYNKTQSELNNNRGQGTGALKGQSVVSNAQSVLQQLLQYTTGAGGIASLASLGLTFADSTGVLSFDSSKFSSATQGQIAQLSTFLGSTTGGGFLKAANDSLTALTDPISGAFQAGVNSLQASIARENANVGDQQQRLNTMQTNLAAQMSAADTAIASMEQQYTYLAQMFQQMQVNAQLGA